MEELKTRKTMRLKHTDYNRNAVLFLTICTKDRRCILSRIVGTDVLGGPPPVGTDVPGGPQHRTPQIELSPYGVIVDKCINQLDSFYNDLSVESYVIMPNHVHMLIWVKGDKDGPPRTSVPTVQHTIISRFLSTLKRFTNKECGMNIWQYRSFDHIIRNHQDYEEHLCYIYENPIRWYYDELYSEK